MTQDEIITAYDNLKRAHLELLALAKEETDITIRKRAKQKEVSLLRDEIRNININ